MIALNELISHKDVFESKYKLMHKHYNLDKILKLEENFIVLDKTANENRAKCNKMCSEVAELINNQADTKELVSEINKLDKKILKDHKKSQKAMKKINKHLRKLHNLPLDENVLNMPLKTTFDETYNAGNFLAELAKIKEFSSSKQSIKQFIKEQKNVVFKFEKLPIFVKAEPHGKIKHEILLLCDSNATALFKTLSQELSEHSKYLIDKSIKYLKKDSAKEVIATLGNNTIISVEFLGEYVSREIMLKFYDKSIDMTKFVNMIRITIK